MKFATACSVCENLFKESVVLPANPKQIFGDKKVNMGVVPPASTIYEALAMQDGARKYGPFNWRITKVEAMTYVAACRRHLDSWVDGEENARDSGYPHLAHAKACLGILIDAMECSALIDNRPPAGPAAGLLERWEKK
jgi:hypothetical protein